MDCEDILRPASIDLVGESGLSAPTKLGGSVDEANWLFSGDAPYYYWPIWPMIGTAVPAIIAWLSGHAVAQRPADPERDQRRADRARRRQLDR